MKRFVELDLEIELRDWPEGRELALLFGNFNVPQVCCELALLLFGHIDRLTMKSVSSSDLVALNLDRENSELVFFEKENRRLSVLLGWKHLDRLLSFLLEYFRDGVAPVNHLHFEHDSTQQEVTIYVSEVREPLSSEEARKILSSDD